MQSSITMSLRTSDESASSDVDAEIISELDRSQIDLVDEDSLLRRAEMYHAFMKQVPIPTNRGSVIPFTSWVGLSISIKQLYAQPLHYLTNLLLQRWDQSRFAQDHQPLDFIIHPSKAEATIWLVEEIHRLTSSPLHIAQLWMSDPMYHSFIDPIFP